ncbi:hypothetical protein BGZ61DRAFT_555519 [Ilyonectria robusta]|uniref:uncharacterized protein n=1 Tax=Ilyonectria robusta TaxID=1079257 RepID=UPI001E8CBEE6|nr:uncharacterized protein BGZ61DRAFT_555519 [Ilyonectria robusta]KAH8673151.1 hypothetical protein BGZ61DRAFT_555519 [Ilyonectria robusta]
MKCIGKSEACSFKTVLRGLRPQTKSTAAYFWAVVICIGSLLAASHFSTYGHTAALFAIASHSTSFSSPIPSIFFDDFGTDINVYLSTFLGAVDLFGHELRLLENNPFWPDGRTSQASYDWEASGYNYHETPTITGNDSRSLNCPTLPLGDVLHDALPTFPQGPHNQTTPDSSGSPLTALVSVPSTPISSVRTTVCLAELENDAICFEPQAGLPSVHAAASPATGDVFASETLDLVDCTRCPKQFSGTDKLREHTASAHPTPGCQCACDVCTGKIGGECNLTTGVAPYRCRCGLQSMQKQHFKAHIRTANRRQIQCRCSNVYREDKFKSHAKSCKQGDHPFVCWRPGTAHRVQYTSKESFMIHYDQCERRRKGRPRNRIVSNNAGLE